MADPPGSSKIAFSRPRRALWGLGLIAGLLASGPAAGEWLRADAKLVGQSGYLFGLAAHCGFHAGSALLLETMAYVDLQRPSETDRRQAGLQFRAGSEIALQDMDDPALSTPCADALTRIEKRLEDLRAVNARGEKLAP